MFDARFLERLKENLITGKFEHQNHQRNKKRRNNFASGLLCSCGAKQFQNFFLFLLFWEVQTKTKKRNFLFNSRCLSFCSCYVDIKNIMNRFNQQTNQTMKFFLNILLTEAKARDILLIGGSKSYLTEITLPIHQRKISSSIKAINVRPAPR